MNRALGVRPHYDPDNSIIKQEYITYKGKVYYLSTVDFGIDLGFGDDGGQYWETMLFIKDDWRGEYASRYTSRESAAIGHEQMKEELLTGKIRGIY